MTITRKYFEALLDAFSTLTILGKIQIVQYLKVKKDLYHVINRIQKFNLFELTFSDEFLKALCSEEIHDLTTEKISLVNELHYELYTCLHTKRLRYGGELMQYMLKIKQLLFQLPVEELALLNAIIKIPQDYYYPHDLTIVDDKQKLVTLEKIALEIKKWPTKRDQTKVKQQYYADVENSVKEIIVAYQKYIFDNYPTIAGEFSFFQRKTRGYITQAMSKDAYEFRIHAYEHTDGDRSVRVLHQYYDFYPSYFYNLEEITDQKVSAITIRLQKDTSILNGFFDEPFIHRELVSIFLRIAGEVDVSKFVEFLLKCDNYYIQDGPIANGSYHFDLQGRLDDQWKFFEIFHRHQRSTIVIGQKVGQMRAMQPHAQVIFLFTSRPEEEVLDILRQNNVDVIFLEDLYKRHFSQRNSKVLHWYIQSALSEIKRTTPKPGALFEGDQLIKRLQACIVGE